MAALACCLFLFLLLYFAFFRISDSQKLNIVFRYDDFSGTSSTEVEYEILKLIDYYGFSASFGVIPFSAGDSGLDVTGCIPLPESKIKMVEPYVRSGVLEIAQHGFLHKNSSWDQEKTEFKGLSGEQQAYKIEHGKRLLELNFGTVVTTFIPPWNSYDRSTLEVLEDQDINIISADNYQVSDPSGDISYLPYTLSLDQLGDMLGSGRFPAFARNSIVVLMVHDYDFTEIDQTRGLLSLNDLSGILGEAASSGWRFNSLRDAVAEHGTFDHHSYIWNKRKNNILGHLSIFFTHTGIFRSLHTLEMLYMPPAFVIPLLVMVILMYLIFMIVFAEIVIQLLFMARTRLIFVELSGIAVMILFAILLFIFFKDDLTLGSKEVMLLTLFAGTWLGMVNFLRIIGRISGEIIHTNDSRT